MRAAAISCALVLALAHHGAMAAPIEIPKLDGHVVDPAAQLGPMAVDLDRELDLLHRRTGFAVVVWVTKSLGDAPIDDVAYKAFNTWKIGDKVKDDGILVVVATTERKVRIETGKGAGGVLTDLESNDIIRTQMGPALALGDVRGGVQAGVNAIEKAIQRAASGVPAAAKSQPHGGGTSWVLIAIIGGVLVIVLVMAATPRLRPYLGPMWSVFSIVVQILAAIFGGRRGDSGGKDRYKGGGGSSGGGGSTDSY